MKKIQVIPIANVGYRVEKGVARITLNNPKANCLNKELAEGIYHALKVSDEDPRVNVRYITGEGRFFCAGLDLKNLDLSDIGPVIDMIKKFLNPLMLKLIRDSKLVVCAINGPAVGAGASIAVGADLTYMSATATFSFPFAKLGLVPDALSSHILPRIVGHKKAMEIFAFGNKIDASEAEKIGLINGTYPDAIFQEKTLEKAIELADIDPKILKHMKMLIASRNAPAETHADLELNLQAMALRSERFKEAVMRFRRGS